MPSAARHLRHSHSESSQADFVNGLLRLFDIMLPYAGTYSLHDDRVVHHVDASWNHAWTGTDQIRFFKLEGDMLTLTGAPAPDPYTGQEVVHRIEFRKVPPES